jgi:hypothetical protein
MAVSEVKLSSTGAGGSVSAGDSKTIILGGSYRSRYRVKCDSTSDTPVTVLNHFYRTSSLPYIGRRFKVGNGFDSKSLCRGVDVNYVEGSGGHFIAEARFEPITVDIEGDTPDGQKSRDPFEWHDEIEVTYTQFSQPVEKAKFYGFTSGANRYMPAGKELPLTNSARIPLDPPLEEEIDIKIIRITKIARAHDDTGFDKYNGTVNLGDVVINKREYGFRTIIPSRCGKLRIIGGQFQIQNGVKFWRQTAEVHVNPQGWRRQVLDLGLDELYASGDTTPSGMAVNATTTNNRGYLYEKIKDEAGYPIGVPVPFNGQGKRNTPSAAAVYGEWATKKEISWSAIRW